jgi:hypothetical protein
VPAQRLPRPLVLGLAVAVASVPLVRYLNRHGAINPFDPSGGRIATFELQTGEVAVMVRVRHDATPSAGVAVWAEPVNRDDEDSDQPRYRKGKTDRSGLAKVPVLKGHGGLTRLFARDSNGRVGGGTIQGERLLSAGDVVLSDVAPRAGRLVTTTGEPIRGAKIAAETFSPGFGTNGEGITLIEIPEPLRRDYTVTTDRDGRFEMPGVPNGFGCRATFDTAGYGEGELTFPATAPWECTLAPAGEIGILVGGDGTAADAKGMKLVVTA